MADTIRCVFSATLDVIQIKDATDSPSASAAGRRRAFGAYSVVGELLNADSFPSPTLPPVDLSVTLGASATTFDLTAAPAAEDNDITVNLNGGKLVAIIIKCPSDNTGDITIAPGASNGHALFGSGNELDIRPGQVMNLAFVNSRDEEFVAGTQEVDSTHKTVTISGAEGDVLECLAVFGE